MGERREETNNFPFYQTQSVSQSAVSAASQVQAVMFVFVRKPTQSNQSLFFNDENSLNCRKRRWG